MVLLFRIFDVGPLAFSNGRRGFRATGMSYPDFIYFMLAEEDRSSEIALAYWYVMASGWLLYGQKNQI